MEDTYWLVGAGLQSADSDQQGLDAERFTFHLGAEHRIGLTNSAYFFGQGGLMHVDADVDVAAPNLSATEENFDFFLTVGVALQVTSFASAFVQFRPLVP
ncbi:MAG: hypothetical protein AAGG01_03600 [Planctomycetota bacterium]